MPSVVFNEEPIRRTKVLGYIVDDHSISRVVEYEYDNPSAPGESRLRQVELETVTRKELRLHNIEEQADLHHKSQTVCQQMYGKKFDDWSRNQFTEKGK